MKITTNLTPERRSEMVESGAWKDKTITHHLDKAVTSSGEKTAIVTYQMADNSRTELSYRELNEKVTRMAAGLAGLGVEKGDIVSCQLPNWWQMTALYLACVRIGAVLNPMMPIFRENELRYMLSFAESRVMVIPAYYRRVDYPAMVESLRGELPALQHVLVIGGEGENSFEDVLLNRAWEEECDVDALFAERQLDGDDVVQLLYTSGTTGSPKGVLHSSNTLFSNVQPYAERLGLSSDDRILMSSPMAHQTGFLYGLMMPIYLGTTAVLQDTWSAEYAVEIITAETPTFTMASTPFLADLVEQAPQHAAALSSLRFFVAAGAPIPSPLVEKAAKSLETRIISAWGMTENGAVTMTRPQDDISRSIESDGLALPHVEVKVTDMEGNPLPPGEEGPLLMRGASLFLGYLKRPDLYEVDQDGWFPTGDLARMDEQGYIRITGRSKDVVIRGGENIPVVEIENLLYKHPKVQALALVGKPDPRLGERACAYVTLKDGVESLTLEEVTNFLVDHKVTRQFLPEFLVVVDELPRTPSGKIQKFKLREQASQSE